MSNDKPADIDHELLYATVTAVLETIKEATGRDYGIALVVVAPETDSHGRRYCRHVSNIAPLDLARVFENTAQRIHRMAPSEDSPPAKAMH